MSSTPGQAASTPETSKMTTRSDPTGIQKNEPDLEKLGRDRPSHFSSQWSELAFCFSIVMSQILAVRHLHAQNITASLTPLTGILHHRIEPPPTDPHQRARYPRSFHNMADYSLVPRGVCHATHLRSLDGHVWRIPPL